MILQAQPGTVLSNGAVLLLSKPKDEEKGTVLCVYESNFVIWTCYYSDGLCRGGDYFGKDLDGALKTFNQRT
jgi:hypothetical protein